MFGLPNPYVILGAAMIWASTCGYSFYKGYQWADRSAELSAVTSQLASAKELAEQMRLEAVTARAIADRATERANKDEEELRDLREKIDVFVATEENKPAADVCRLDDSQYRSLSDLAAAASGHSTSPSSVPSKPRPR
jgi:soluble cytochrome b562